MTWEHAALAGYRFRAMTPSQESAARAAWRNGVRAEALAREYGVSRRTIYRSLLRAAAPVHVVTVGSWQAEFVLGEDGPIRRTPWYPL